MDALIFDSSKKRFFFAYQDLVLDPVRTSSLRGVEIPLFSISINDNNGDSQSYLTLGQSKISKELFPSSPLKKHFKFLGWSYVDGGQAVSLDEIKVDGDLSFYASWRELPKFTIEYFSNGVLEKTSEPITIWADDSFTVESSVTLKKNFKFLEWNSKPDGSGIKYLPGKAITALDSNLKLYAIGKPNVTISCVKGKTIKKLTGPNPKCPAGYMKK
jgi:hypothetical protein